MKIDTFDIHAGVIWVNEITEQKAVQQKTTSMLGNINIIHGEILKKEMIFEARGSGRRSRGYFTREVVNYLMNAEGNNSQFVIEYRGINYNVIVPSGGVQLTPIKEIEDIADPDPHTGTVTFQEI